MERTIRRPAVGGDCALMRLMVLARLRRVVARIFAVVTTELNERRESKF